jgi:hypothetical protein
LEILETGEMKRFAADIEIRFAMSPWMLFYVRNSPGEGSANS